MLQNQDYRCKPCRNKAAKSKYHTKEGKIYHHNIMKKYQKINPNIYYQAGQKWRKKIAGVYGIYENGECLYIGESIEINNRISRHKTNTKKPEQAGTHASLYYKLQQHKHLIFGIIEECDNHKERETEYINKLKPKYNGN